MTLLACTPFSYPFRSSYHETQSQSVKNAEHHCQLLAERNKMDPDLFSARLLVVTMGYCFNRGAVGGYNDEWMEVKCVKKTLVTERYSLSSSFLLVPGQGDAFSCMAFSSGAPQLLRSPFSFSDSVPLYVL